MANFRLSCHQITLGFQSMTVGFDFIPHGIVGLHGIFLDAVNQVQQYATAFDMA